VRKRLPLPRWEKKKRVDSSLEMLRESRKRSKRESSRFRISEEEKWKDGTNYILQCGGKRGIQFATVPRMETPEIERKKREGIKSGFEV